MSHSGRHTWRLFCWALCLVFVANRASSQTPQLTTVSDTVFQADGSPAAGTLLISWPAFIAAGGATVAAGSKSVALGTNGSLSVQLAPNVGATPSGTVYTVTYRQEVGI